LTIEEWLKLIGFIRCSRRSGKKGLSSDIALRHVALGKCCSMRMKPEAEEMKMAISGNPAAQAIPRSFGPFRHFREDG
jgi:hypothetical protein